MEVERYFRELGATTELLWTEACHDEREFPSVAQRALTEAAPPSSLDTRCLLRYAATRPLPVQADPIGMFGQPPVTFYVSEAGFFIDALFWFDGTTTIHRHQFSGAFHVLEGASLHVPYRFDETLRMSDRLVFGNLQPGRPEVLRQGDTRPIVAGDAGIHSLFHLYNPSITIVVRTAVESRWAPQYDYMRPGIAYDPKYKSEALTRKRQALSALHRVDPAAALEVARGLMRDMDHVRAFALLRSWPKQTGWSGGIDTLLAEFTARFPTQSVDLKYAFELWRREDALVTRRSLLRDVRHRLFLAVLLNVPDWAARRDAFSSLFPNEDAGVVMADIVGELAAPEMRGVSGFTLDEAELASVQEAIRSGADADQVDTALSSLSAKAQNLELVEALFG